MKHASADREGRYSTNNMKNAIINSASTIQWLGSSFQGAPGRNYSTSLVPYPHRRKRWSPTGLQQYWNIIDVGIGHLSDAYMNSSEHVSTTVVRDAVANDETLHAKRCSAICLPRT